MLSIVESGNLDSRKNKRVESRPAILPDGMSYDSAPQVRPDYPKRRD